MNIPLAYGICPKTTIATFNHRGTMFFPHITHFTPSRHRFFLSSSVQDVRIHQEIQAHALVSWSTLISLPKFDPRDPRSPGTARSDDGGTWNGYDMRNDMTLRTCGFFAWKISQKMGYDIPWYTMIYPKFHGFVMFCHHVPHQNVPYLAILCGTHWLCTFQRPSFLVPNILRPGVAGY